MNLPPAQDWKRTLAMLALAAFPVTFLSVRHGVHASLAVLLLLAALDAFGRAGQRFRPRDALEWQVCLAYSGLLVANALTQALHGLPDPQALDGPSRLLLAGLVFGWLRRQGLPVLRVLELALPAAALVLLGVLEAHPETSQVWEGRLASRFVDPNSMGSQTLLMGWMCFALLRGFDAEGWLMRAWKVAGGSVALYISVNAGSRGGWLSLPFLLGLWFWLQARDAARKPAAVRRRQQRIAVIVLAGAMVAGGVVYANSSMLSARLSSGYHEIADWLSGRNQSTSAGYRLSMWRVSLALAAERPLTGYGERTLRDPAGLLGPQASASDRDAIRIIGAAGPHSDMLAKLLGGGLVELAAYLALLWVPAALAWKRQHDDDPEVRCAARMTLFYVVGVLLCGLANEMMSLKYLCAYYGLMSIALLAQACPAGGAPVRVSAGARAAADPW